MHLKNLESGIKFNRHNVSLNKKNGLKMAFAAARMIKDKEAKMNAGQKRSTDINQSYSKYNLQKVKEQKLGNHEKK